MRDLAPDVRRRIGVELRLALKAKDAVAVAALRTLAGAIDNAGAAPLGPGDQRPDLRLSSTHLAVGGVHMQTEAPRRPLGAEDLAALFATELERRREAAATYDALGRSPQSARMRAEIAVLEPLMRRLAAAAGDEGAYPAS